MSTVRDLERQLFAAFPAEDATVGDRIGLLVGSEESEVTGIGIALDAKVTSIEAAAAAGCNVLVTHHPVFWYPPTQFLREGTSEGASIYRAAELGISLIAMHTNLDCAPIARELLLGPAGFSYESPLSLPSEADKDLLVLGKLAEIPRDSADKPVPALGQIGKPRGEAAVALHIIAERYKEAFGAVAKAWGDPDKPITSLATCSGGGGSLIWRVINSGADCYVTGEFAYHEALELAAADIALIELGHDRSELPYRFVLYDTLLARGYETSMLHVLDPIAGWWQ